MSIVTTRSLLDLREECAAADIIWDSSWSREQLFDALRLKYGAFDTKMQLDPMKAIATKDMLSIEHLLTPDYACEPKLDGIRLRMFIGLNGSSLNSGRRSVKTFSYTDRSANFPHLAAIGHESLVGVILDGELISAKPNLPRGSGGWTHSLLTASAALNNSKPDAAVKVQREHGWAQFHAFDLLGNADGSTMELPYRERRILLEDVMAQINVMSCAGVPQMNLVPSVPATREQIVAYVAEGYEGAMIKDRNSPYLPGKRKFWWKSKDFHTADAFIIGYVDGLNRNEGLVGGIRLAVQDAEGKPLEIAQCGNLTDAFRAEISNPDGSLKAEWYNRVIEWSAQCLTLTSNKARHPYMVRWRPDKTPEDCTMDQLDNFPRM